MAARSGDFLPGRGLGPPPGLAMFLGAGCAPGLAWDRWVCAAHAEAVAFSLLDLLLGVPALGLLSFRGLFVLPTLGKLLLGTRFLAGGLTDWLGTLRRGFSGFSVFFMVGFGLLRLFPGLPVFLRSARPGREVLEGEAIDKNLSFRRFIPASSVLHCRPTSIQGVWGMNPQRSPYPEN